MAASSLEAPRGPLDHAELRHFLNALRLQLWWRDALALAAATTAAGAIIGVGLLLWPVGPAWPGGGTRAVGWVMLLAVAIGAALAVVRRPSIIRAARVVDRQLSTASRLATAAEVLDRRLEGRLARAQLADAWLTASAIRPMHAYPRAWRRVWAAAALAVVSLVLAGLSVAGAFNPLDLYGHGASAQSAAAPEAEAAQMMADSAAAADAQALAADGSANPASAAQTLEELQAAAAQSQLAEAALQRLADALRPTSAASDVGEALRRGDYEDASSRLIKLGREADQVSRQSRRELAGALQRAAFDSTRLDPPLAVAEERAARALNRQIYTEIRSTLDNLAKAVGDAKKGIISQEALAQQLDQLQEQTRGPAGAGGDDPEGYVGDTPGEHAERTGLVRGVNSTIQLPGPEGDPRTASHSGVGKEAGGDPLGDLASRLNVPPTDISVETFLANDKGHDKPSPGAPTVRISETNQQGVRRSGVAQTGDPVQDVAEQIVEPNTQRATVRAFFKSAGDASQSFDRVP